MKILPLPPASLRKLALSLDLPDCNCKPDEVCPHVALAPDHDLNLEEWAELLQRVFPGQFTEPPPPSAPAVALSRQARVAVLEERRARRMALWHPLDSWRQENHVEFEVEVQAVRLRNGAVDPEERLTARPGAALAAGRRKAAA